MRIFHLIVLVMYAGCAMEMDHLEARALDAGVSYESPLRGGSVTQMGNLLASADSNVAIRTEVDSGVDFDGARDGDRSEGAMVFDSFSEARESEPSCVQRVIDNGYQSCALEDAHHTSCATCPGSSDDPQIGARCRSTIDCLLQNLICDEACFLKCEGVPTDTNVRVCVYKVITPFCGMRPWLPSALWASWNCKNAL